MDDGLLPTGNRHTRHLTTFSFFSDPMMYTSLEPHTRISIHTYIHTSVRLYSDFIDCRRKKKRFDIDGNSLVHFHLTFLMYNFFVLHFSSPPYNRFSFHSKLEQISQFQTHIVCRILLRTTENRKYVFAFD
jgi:hypothetical protein